MPYQIDAELSDKLLQQPEYGMGFQLATAPPATPGGNQLQNYAIVNATWALAMDEDWRPEPEEFHEFDLYVTALASAAPAPAKVAHVKPPVLKERFPFGFDDLSLHTHGSFEATVGRTERFCRFSAFPNDRRIRRGGIVLPGTYITSVRDSEHVNTGLSAVARYALPTHAPAIFRFDITVRPEEAKRLTLMCGTVKPAHDQSGGGIEFRTPGDGKVVASKEPSLIPAW